eukprot:scaffold23654_cov45-Isochrysis_galbana.AAC.1
MSPPSLTAPPTQTPRPTPAPNPTARPPEEIPRGGAAGGVPRGEGGVPQGGRRCPSASVPSVTLWRRCEVSSGQSRSAHT